MKRGYIIAILVLTVTFISAQEQAENAPRKNTLYADIGVNPYAGSATFNYERYIWNSESGKTTLNFRTGFLTGGIVWGNAFMGVPVNLTGLFGNGKHSFETSAGAAIGVWAQGGFDRGEPVDFGVFPVIDLGYRFVGDQGFVFRAKLGLAGFGIGLGYSF